MSPKKRNLRKGNHNATTGQRKRKSSFYTALREAILLQKENYVNGDQPAEDHDDDDSIEFHASHNGNSFRCLTSSTAVENLNSRFHNVDFKFGYGKEEGENDYINGTNSTECDVPGLADSDDEDDDGNDDDNKNDNSSDHEMEEDDYDYINGANSTGYDVPRLVESDDEEDDWDDDDKNEDEEDDHGNDNFHYFDDGDNDYAYNQVDAEQHDSSDHGDDKEDVGYYHTQVPFTYF